MEPIIGTYLVKVTVRDDGTNGKDDVAPLVIAALTEAVEDAVCAAHAALGAGVTVNATAERTDA